MHKKITPSRQKKTVTRVRMAPDDRKKMIVDAAISFFAKNGLAAQTRDLAKDIGVSQALIFKYFESKENLLECVYKEVFLDHWDPRWELELADRDMPLRDRLIRFYLQYAGVVNDYNWIRICLQASLSNQDLTRRYINEHLTRLLGSIAMEIRRENSNNSQEELSAWEIEKVWIAHAAIVYYSVRSHVHKTAVMKDTTAFVEGVVDTVMPGLTPATGS